MGISKCNKILHIIRIRSMLRRWRRAAQSSSARKAALPSDVPAGHVAVVVGPMQRRYVVRATVLNHPAFEGILVGAEEEYGFARAGPLAIPCDEPMFEAAIRLAVRRDLPEEEDLRRGSCHVRARRDVVDFLNESRRALLEV